MSEALKIRRSMTRPGPVGLAILSERFERSEPQEILEWAVDTYGEKLALSASFGGAEGMALLDMLSKITDEVPVLTIDTGFLFRETVEFREEVMRRYKLPLRVLRPALSVEEQVALHGEGLRTCQPDLCCRIRKVEPLERALKDYEAWTTGIRREQTPQRADTPILRYDGRFGAAKVAPLARWSTEQVWDYVRENDVPVNPLLHQGYLSIGCEPQTRPVQPGEDARAGRWSDSEKTECGLHWVGGKVERAVS